MVEALALIHFQMPSQRLLRLRLTQPRILKSSEDRTVPLGLSGLQVLPKHYPERRGST